MLKLTKKLTGAKVSSEVMWDPVATSKLPLISMEGGKALNAIEDKI